MFLRQDQKILSIFQKDEWDDSLCDSSKLQEI